MFLHSSSKYFACRQLALVLLCLITSMATSPLMAEDASDIKQPAKYVGPLKPEHAVTNRAFQGIPSLAVAKSGRLWATWYAGVTPSEDSNNYVILSTSGDNGKTWEEVLVVDPDGAGPVRTYDPELWLAPDGNLRLIWAQTVGHTGTVAGVWFLKITNPDEAQPEYEQPRRITDGVMMCKPLVLSTGEWLLPASTWRETDNSAKVVVSSDMGKTWTVRGGCHLPKKVRAFDEHMLIEKENGTLWLLARTRYGIGESVSTDGGVTWPDLAPSNIPHPSARFFIRRLNSGNLLLVKHGPLDKQIGRSHLTAYLSTDDGKSWQGGLLIDERSSVSYPDGQQTEDGVIHIIYDFDRTGARHILRTSFTEADILAKKDVSSKVIMRQVVSEGSGGQEKK
ncbi:sialidase family protein [Polystyrenella longa]|nr:sialidase family protein [Polystyrenella longa]